MKKDCLQLNLSSAWSLQGGVAVIGYAFFNDTLLSGVSLAHYFSAVQTLGEFTLILQKLNGIFSVIISKENFTAAAIDTTRIYPVFYSYSKGKWQVTDNPYSLITNESSILPSALEQMRSSFAPLQGKTLVEGILQVKPCTAIEFLSAGETQTSIYFHYNINASQVCKASKSQVLSALESAVKRLVKRASGKQIVVPMSAGYDSRIILCLLKEQGYKNVITYTIGSNDSASEVSVASKVACALGYAHYPIDLTKVGDELDFSDFNDYVMHLGALTNFSWLGEYASVKCLQAKGVLEKDAIFVPGHAGDFFAGSHLSKSLIGETSSISALVYGILFNNFEANKSLKTAAIKKEFNAMQQFGTYPPSLYNAFVFANRLTHFITNSARAFTFFGHEVLMPLWDMEFLCIMRSLSMKQLHHCALYNECVEQVFERNGVNYKKHQLPTSAYRKQYIKNIISAVLASAFLQKAKRPTQDILGTWHLAEMLCKHFSTYKSKAPKPYSINSALTEWYIGTIQQLLNKK